MVKRNKTDLAIGTPLEKRGDNDTPDWMRTVNEIVQGVNNMIGGYMNIQSKSGANEMPGINMIGTEKIKTTQPQPTSELQEVVEMAAEILSKLDGMGFGDSTLADAISAFPVKISAARKYLDDYRKSRYGENIK